MKVSPCEKDRINEFFQSESSCAEVELAQHLEACESCRQYFDYQAAPPYRWREATQLLQPTEFDQASTAEFSAAALGQRAPHQPLMIQSVLDSLAPTDDPHRLGRLGGYEISGVIGVGGMGVVLKAFDPALDRVVAIKVMAPHLANNGSSRKRFTREARAAAAVLHPNVIPIHSVSSDAALPYLVMAYIRGGSLQKRLQQQGPCTTVECLRIGAQIAAGLAAAHEQGLVHRDIKPENILLDEGVERVTLTDFGLARAVDDASVTRDGTIAGTPQYMSPEQTLGKSIDQQSDLFSLGSVLYTLCTGRPPFRADSSYAVMRKISDEAPLPIRELNPEIPAWLCAIIGKLMEKNKIHRYKTAREVHELLEACLAHAQQPTVFQLPAPLRAGNNSAGRFLKLAAGSPRLLTVSAALAIFLGIGIDAAFFAPPPANQAANEIPGEGEALGFSYTRKGDFIYYNGRRIDQAGKETLLRASLRLGQMLKLAQDVDAASFKVLSDEYTKDKNKVYYKWNSPDGQFWVVELPKAEAMSFEVIGFNLGKDNKQVWWYGSPMPGVDPKTVELVNDGFVWKDAKNVWYQDEQIVEADPRTFRHLEQAFYSDKSHVYWSGTRLNGANPVLFRTFGDESPYGADLNCVWRGSEQIFNVDAPSFETVHQSVYLDKNGVYASGNPLDNADPKTFRKLVNLDIHFTALLADANQHYVYLPYRGEVYRVWLEDKALKVERRIWSLKDPRKPAAGYKSVGIFSAELGANGWINPVFASDLPPKESQSFVDEDIRLLKLYDGRFAKAKEILSKKPDAKEDVPKEGNQ